MITYILKKKYGILFHPDDIRNLFLKTLKKVHTYKNTLVVSELKLAKLIKDLSEEEVEMIAGEKLVKTIFVDKKEEKKGEEQMMLECKEVLSNLY